MKSAEVRKVVFLHTDFRLYWKARLDFLHSFFRDRNVALTVIEIAGKGSPYSFEHSNGISAKGWWRCLFPYDAIESIEPRKAVNAVLQALDDINPDAVFAGAIAFSSGAAAVRWGAWRRKPVVIFDNARLEDVPRAGYVDWIKRQMYSLVDAMLIPAPSHDKTFRYFGFSQEQLFYGINCVDNQFFTVQSELYRSSEPPHTKPFLLAVGRQVPKKNWSRLINAYRNVVQSTESEPFDLLLVGDGPEHEALVDCAGDLCGKNIHFIPFKSQDELCAYYAHADGLVLPSQHGETWGLVVNEAMASGLPVLVSSVCGCAETLVRTGVNGYIIDPDDVGSICEALLLFMKMTGSQKKNMGENSASIISDWGLERFCEGVWDAFEYVLSQKKKRGKMTGQIIANFWDGRYNPS